MEASEVILQILSMTKKVNKKNAIVLILVLLVVGLIYWAYASKRVIPCAAAHSLVNLTILAWCRLAGGV